MNVCSLVKANITRTLGPPCSPHDQFFMQWKQQFVYTSCRPSRTVAFFHYSPPPPNMCCICIHRWKRNASQIVSPISNIFLEWTRILREQQRQWQQRRDKIKRTLWLNHANLARIHIHSYPFILCSFACIYMFLSMSLFLTISILRTFCYTAHTAWPNWMVQKEILSESDFYWTY